MQALASAVPAVAWLPHYRPAMLLDDLLAGFTLATLLIPQSIGYAVMANLPPVRGLYTASVPALAYFVFGASPFLSIAPFAVTALLAGESALSAAEWFAGLRAPGNATEPAMLHEANLPWQTYPDLTSIAALQALMLGLLLMAVRLSGMHTLLARIATKPLVDAFTVAASFAILTSQIKHVVGVRVSARGTVGVNVIIWISVLLNLPSANVAAAALGFAAMAMIVAIPIIESRIYEAGVPSAAVPTAPVPARGQPGAPDTAASAVHVAGSEDHPAPARETDSLLRNSASSVNDGRALMTPSVSAHSLERYGSLPDSHTQSRPRISRGSTRSRTSLEVQPVPPVKPRVRVPAALVTIATLTAVASALDLAQTHKLPVVGQIQSGFPTFSLPWVFSSAGSPDPDPGSGASPRGQPTPSQMAGLVLYLLPSTISIALVTHITTVSILHSFPSASVVHDDGVASQLPLIAGIEAEGRELAAMAMSQITASFFSCFISGAGLARSAVLVSQTGARSPLACLFSVLIVLGIVTFAAFLFESIPMAVLSAVIVVAIARSLARVMDIVVIVQKALEADKLIADLNDHDEDSRALTQGSDAQSTHADEPSPQSRRPPLEGVLARFPRFAHAVRRARVWEDSVVWIATLVVTGLIDSSLGILVGLALVVCFRLAAFLCGVQTRD